MPPAPCHARHQGTLTEAKEGPDTGTQEKLVGAVLVWLTPEKPAARGGQQRNHHLLQGWVGKETSALPSPAARGQPWPAAGQEGISLVLGGFCLLRASVPAKHSCPGAITGSMALCLVLVTAGCSPGTSAL